MKKCRTVLQGMGMAYTDVTGNYEIINAGIVGNLPVEKLKYPLRRFTDYAQTLSLSKPKSEFQTSESAEPFMSIFGRIGFGYLVLDERMTVTKWNEPARLALEVAADSGDAAKAISTAFRQLVAPVACKFKTGAVSWVVIPYKGGKPLVVRDDAVIGDSGISIVMLLSRKAGSHPNPARLQQMFGLTSAEVQLAMRLAVGQTPLEIARQSKVSRTTIRSHLAALFSKTETNRQSELVALLNHISVLP
jgi:DNA-binding CsgD family transcriptional regulator